MTKSSSKLSIFSKMFLPFIIANITLIGLILIKFTDVKIFGETLSADVIILLIAFCMATICFGIITTLYVAADKSGYRLFLFIEEFPSVFLIILSFSVIASSAAIQYHYALEMSNVIVSLTDTLLIVTSAGLATAIFAVSLTLTEKIKTKLTA